MTDEEARARALSRYLHDQACYRDDNESAFLAGWDAARGHEPIDSVSG